jgi:PD-(D/E)XK endonuclease
VEVAMSDHEKKIKGDIGAAQVIADLTMKEYTVFTPVVCESLPFDIIAYKNGKSYRIQAKYSSDGIAKSATSWADKNGNHRNKYSDEDFDYYGLYLSSIGRVVYPSVKFRGCTIATEVRNSAQPFYWWEDFVNFTDSAEKKNYKHFGKTLEKVLYTPRLGVRRIVRPEKEVLEKLLWEKPTVEIAADYQVTDNAIGKWAKLYGLSKPPRGYWAKKNSKV